MKSTPSHLPMTFPTIPCCNNWVVTQPIRCQGRAEGLPLILVFWGACHVSPHPKQTVKQWPSLFLYPLFISRGLGCWGVSGEEARTWSRCRTETSAASPHSHLCQREMSLEWHKEINAVFCERRGGAAGYRCLFFLPNRWSLMLTHKCCFIRSSPLSSLRLVMLVHLSFFLLSGWWLIALLQFVLYVSLGHCSCHF